MALCTPLTLTFLVQAYSVYIQSQQAILGATQFVMELNKAMDANADMSTIYGRMRELELFLEPLNTRAEAWDFLATATSPVDPSEEVISRSLRAMARIKLNRYGRGSLDQQWRRLTVAT